MEFIPAEIIKRKRGGLAHSVEEIEFLIQNYSQGRIPDYQVSAWLMAVFFRGMNSEETGALTQAILDSGLTMTWPKEIGPPVDKHSTGGVGDKTSLILGPIAAAAGVPVPMISGRGLGHTGGTLDKLESIPGFQVNLSLDEFKKGVLNHSLCFIGQTTEICPADKKLYALRDVTGTVESLPLICSSILSKKISEGIESLVLDVKFGSGAFMKTQKDAETLAEKLIEVAQTHGKKVGALITSMEQPLGRFSGNALEVYECLEIMKGKSFISTSGNDLYQDTRELSIELAGMMIWLGNKATSFEEGKSKAKQLLESGEALRKFEEVCQAQGGDLSKIHLPEAALEIKAEQSGYISQIDTERIGIANILLGAGRLKTSDSVEAYAGVEVCAKIGDHVKEGEPIFKLYGTNQESVKHAQQELKSALNYSLQNCAAPDLIKRRYLP